MLVIVKLEENLDCDGISWKNFRKTIISINISIMSKVFTDFSKIKPMNKALLIAIPIASAVIIGIVAFTIFSGGPSNEIEKTGDDNSYEVLPREWQTSGPFQIDRKKYALGEKIFIVIEGLPVQEKGEIVVMRPSNSTIPYITIPFDGAQKNEFNYYLDPQLARTRGLCSVDDVLGKWSLVFKGTNYSNLNFEIVNKTVPGTNWEPVC